LASKLEPALDAFRGPGTPPPKLNAFLGVAKKSYDSGACVPARATVRQRRAEEIRQAAPSTFEKRCLEAFGTLSVESGRSRPAKGPREDAVIRIEARWCSAPGSTARSLRGSPSARSEKRCSDAK